MHEARVPEFTHAGINQRDAGFSTLPCGEIRGRIAPIQMRKALLHRRGRDILPMKQLVDVEVAPGEFAKEGLDASALVGSAAAAARAACQI